MFFHFSMPVVLLLNYFNAQYPQIPITNTVSSFESPIHEIRSFVPWTASQTRTVWKSLLLGICNPGRHSIAHHTLLSNCQNCGRPLERHHRVCEYHVTKYHRTVAKDENVLEGHLCLLYRLEANIPFTDARGKIKEAKISEADPRKESWWFASRGRAAFGAASTENTAANSFSLYTSELHSPSPLAARWGRERSSDSKQIVDGCSALATLSR